jgi:cytochrome bd-type quinol oxidase subunit 2
MNTLKRLMLVLALTFTVGLVPVNAGAASVIADQCAGVTDSSVCKGQNAKPGDLIKNIVNTLLYIVGAVSVVMIIVGGIMYTTSAGDSGRVTKAKNTVTYAIVGLVVSFLAFAIVQFVVSKLK